MDGKKYAKPAETKIREPHHVCNRCGKKFDVWDENGEYNISTHACYGSKYDETYISIRLCSGCFDKLIEECVIPPYSVKESDEKFAEPLT